MAPVTVGILGGTGRTGGWVLEACLQNDYKVYALMRSPDKLRMYYDTSPICKSDDTKVDSITVVKGDATSADDIKSLLETAEKNGSPLDVIISTLGSPSKTLVIVKKAAEALVGALGAASTIPRVVWMTSTGINEATDQAKSYSMFGKPRRWLFGYGGFGWLQYKIIIPYLISWELWNDMGFSEDVIRANEKVYSKTVIVRPTNMHPASESSPFSEAWWKEACSDDELPGYVLINADDPPPGKWVNRRIIAAALIDLATNTTYDGTAKSLFAK